MSVDLLAVALAPVKWALYVTALLAAGLSFHIILGIVAPDRRAATMRLSAKLAVAACMIAGLRLLSLNAQMTGGLAAAFDFSMFAWIWRPNAVAAIALALGAAGVVAGAVFKLAPLAAAGGLLMTGAFALTGHTQALDNPTWAPTAAFAHATIGAFWVAAPLTLWPRPGDGPDDLARRLDGFSRIALIAIPTLFLLGVVLALRLAGSVDALLAKPYGQLILAKLAAATIALALGAANKLVVTGDVKADRPRARRNVKVALAADAVLFSLALAFVAVATTLVGPD